MTPIKTTIFTVSILAWVIKNQNRINSSDFVDYGLAPTAGLEPATSKLTASCSTIELRRNTEAIIPLTPVRGQGYPSVYEFLING